MKHTYRAWTYDLWGNDEDGYWVNDRYDTGEIYELDDTWNDKQIIKALRKQGCLKKGVHSSSIEIDGEFGYILYFNYKGNPDFELVCEDV